MIPKIKIGDMEAYIGDDKHLALIQGDDVVVLEKDQFIELKRFTDFEDF